MAELYRRGYAPMVRLAHLIAKGLRPIDEVEWRRMIDTGSPVGSPIREVGPPPEIGPPPGAVPPPTAWLAVLPVIAREAPPCKSIHELWLAETKAGREVACYKVSAPALNAGDVAKAAARPDRTTGTWTVELTLTEPGTARLTSLFRDACPVRGLRPAAVKRPLRF